MNALSQVMELRWGIRVCVDATAELRSGDGMFAIVAVRNTSLSGAFVETMAKLPALSRVAVRPVAKQGDWLDATVVRVEDNGVAIEWLDPGVHALHVLLSPRPTDR